MSGVVKRTWRDVEDLAHDLGELHPGTDPLTLSLDEVRALVVTLPAFGDKPDAATDEILEAVQAAWYDLSEE